MLGAGDDITAGLYSIKRDEWTVGNLRRIHISESDCAPGGVVGHLLFECGVTDVTLCLCLAELNGELLVSEGAGDVSVQGSTMWCVLS